MEKLIILLIVLIIVYLLAKKLLRGQIKDRLYQPIKHHLKLREVEYRDIYLNVKTNKYLLITGGTKDLSLSPLYINVWYLHKFVGRPIVLYFHGNSYNISYRKYMIDICNLLNLNLFLVDYRGYGKSMGQASAENVIIDAEASYRFLIKEGNSPQDIIVWGESLGGSPACYVASKYGVRSLILLSTFSSLHDLMTDNSNPIRESAFWFLRFITTDINHLTNNKIMMRKVSCPVLLFHSKEDRIIPYSHATQLKSEAITSSSVELITIEGDHDSPKITADDFSKLTEILQITVEREKLPFIVKIIDSLSFVAEESNKKWQRSENNSY